MKFSDISFKSGEKYAREAWNDERYISFIKEEHVKLTEYDKYVNACYEEVFNRKNIDGFFIKARIDMIIPDTLEMIYNWNPSIEDATTDDWYKIENWKYRRK